MVTFTPTSTVDYNGNLFQAQAFSVDTVSPFGNTASKQLTALVSSGALNTASVTTTKLAGTVTIGGVMNTNAASAGGLFTLTINNTSVGGLDQCMATATTITPSSGVQCQWAVAGCAPSSGALVVTLANVGTAPISANGATVSYIVFKN